MKDSPNTPLHLGEKGGAGEPKHITITTDTFTPDINGVAMTISRIASGLVSRGFRVTVISHSGVKVDEEIERSGNGATIIHIPSFPLPGYAAVRVGLPVTRRLKRLWKSDRPDCIYVATESPFGKSAVKAADALGIPLATGFHTNLQSYAAHYKLPCLSGAVMRWMKKFHSRAFVTFTPSHDTAEELRDNGFQNVKIMGRGVDTELFSPERRDRSLRESWGVPGGSDDTPVALYVGRVAKEKNPELLVATFHHLQSINPDTRCVVVGDGPVLAELRKNHPEFVYAGAQRGEDLARHYASADLFVFPGLTETYGNTVPEAMASGLVVAAFDYASAGQLVRDGENGFVAEFGNAEAFKSLATNALRRFQDNGIRTNARRSSLGLSWDSIIDLFAETLLGEAHPSPTPQPKTTASPEQQPAIEPKAMPKKSNKRTLRFKTVFLSDIHLGTADSKVTQVIHFLRNVRCEKLVLNGDIIDGWALRRFGRWTKAHTYFVRLILKKMAKEGTEVIYLRGNHDDVLRRFLPMNFDRLHIADEHIHESPHGRYLVVHGDGFDAVTSRFKLITSAGAYSYGALLRLNRLINRYRRWRGKPAYSLSKVVKAKVKSAVSFISRYEEQLQKLAAARGCNGIICGHIHTAANKKVGDVHYLNSGDWVESLTAVVEHLDRRFEVISYNDFCRLSNRKPKGHVEPPSKYDFREVSPSQQVACTINREDEHSKQEKA